MLWDMGHWTLLVVRSLVIIVDKKDDPIRSMKHIIELHLV